MYKDTGGIVAMLVGIILGLVIACGLQYCHSKKQSKYDIKSDIIYDSVLVFHRDTVIIHDTIYTSKHYGNVDKVIIGQ